MADEPDTELNLRETTIRICPVCGTVNPAGPSDSCPHLQLFRIRSLDEPLADLLERMAVARNQFRDLLGELKRYMNTAKREGRAEVVPAHKILRFSDIEPISKKPAQPLTLTHPAAEEKSKAPARKKSSRKAAEPEPVDPRQLALLILEAPKGHA